MLNYAFIYYCSTNNGLNCTQSTNTSTDTNQILNNFLHTNCYEEFLGVGVCVKIQFQSRQISKSSSAIALEYHSIVPNVIRFNEIPEN